MSETKIEWANYTFNPWWGCEKVSPGCTHCYAEAFAKRLGHRVWGREEQRRFFGDEHWNAPLRWDEAAWKAGERRRVFCASMADVFEDQPGLGSQRARLFQLVEQTPNLDWLLLSKRPENFASMVPVRWLDGWPRNAWAGVTAEDQERADLRVPLLLGTPAAVRFVSAEPLLGPVDLTRLHDDELGATWNALATGLLDWVIVGGESGAGARPCDLAWVRALRAQCVADGAACFVKQLGATPLADARNADGLRWQQLDPDHEHGDGYCVVRLADRKGGNPAEWPADLLVREFPSPRATGTRTPSGRG